jgi:hypothetical protein
MDLFVLVFGDDAWLYSNDPAWHASFLAAVNNAPPPGALSPSAINSLLSPLPNGMSYNQTLTFLERWSNTMSYWQMGYYELSDLPPAAGYSTNFISYSQFKAATQQIQTDQASEYALTGYSNPQEALAAEVTQAINSADTGSGGGVCAMV